METGLNSDTVYIYYEVRKDYTNIIPMISKFKAGTEAIRNRF